MLPAFGLAGSFSGGGFNTKAEALQYAINFTAINADGGRKADYEAAQEMFDFICKNVKLPETKSESLDSFIERGTTLFESLQRRMEEKEYDRPSKECPATTEEYCNSCASSPDYEIYPDKIGGCDGPIIDPNGPFCEG